MIVQTQNMHFLHSYPQKQYEQNMYFNDLYNPEKCFLWASFICNIPELYNVSINKNKCPK